MPLDLKTLLINEVLPRLAQPITVGSAAIAAAELQRKIPSAKVGTCLADLLEAAPTQQEVAAALTAIASEVKLADLLATFRRRAAYAERGIHAGTITTEAQIIAAFGNGNGNGT